MGMPDHQYKSAMISNSAHAAQGTGKAREHEKSEHAHHELQQDDNDMVTLSFTQAPDDTQQAQQKEKEKEARQKGDESKLERQRMHSSSGHAAMASGAKDKAKEKEAKQSEESEGDPLTMLESAQTELGQAGVTGALQESAKEVRGKKDEKDARFTAMDGVKQRLQGDSGEEVQHRVTVKPEMIEQIMNRSPEEILKDVPPQFRAASEAMVKGQISQAGKPNQTLTELKTVPQSVDCKALELMPAEEQPVMDIWVDAPPIPDLSEHSSAAT
jgi:hypothetical protein